MLLFKLTSTPPTVRSCIYISERVKSIVVTPKLIFYSIFGIYAYVKNTEDDSKPQ